MTDDATLDEALEKIVNGEWYGGRIKHRSMDGRTLTIELDPPLEPRQRPAHGVMAFIAVPVPLLPMRETPVVQREERPT